MKRWFYTTVVLSLAVFCADRVVPTNPYDPDNTDVFYDLIFSWNDTPKVILPFVTYGFTGESTGDEDFEFFTFSIVPDNYVNPKPLERYQFSTQVPVIFTGTGAFTLSITARRLNGSDTAFTFPVTVDNPYSIELDSAALIQGDTIRCRVVNAEMDTLFDTTRTIRWTRDGKQSGDLPFGKWLTLPVQAFDTLKITAQFLDGNGKTQFHLEEISAAVPPGTFPMVSIFDSVRYVPVGFPCQITADDTSGLRTLEWSRDSGVFMTDTTNCLVATWTDAGPDTIFVTPVNRFGTRGAADTLIVIARQYRFNLEGPVFKQVVQAGEWSTWEVTATENGNPVPDDSIWYQWYTIPEKVTDSIRRNRGSFSLKFSDTVPPFILGVSAVSSNDTDSACPKKATITVRVGRPSLRILHSVDTIPINETGTFVLQTTDPDGSIAARYYTASFGAAEPQQFSSDTVPPIKFTDTGGQTITFWCVDNRGFSSSKTTAWILVTSQNPYFTCLSKFDTLVFVNDSVRFSAPADAGNMGSFISDWYWNFNDGAVQVTTHRDCLDTLFTGSGTVSIIVTCKDSADRFSDGSVHMTVTVSEGYPAVTSASCLTPSAFINDSVLIAVTAEDSNKTLAGLNISYGDTTVSYTIDPPVKHFTDTLAFVVRDTGICRFSVTAVDDDSLISAVYSATGSSSIALGSPTVELEGDDSCWINDSYTVTAAGTDPNGKIARYYALWDGAATPDDSNSTGSFSRSFNDSGLHSVKVYAVDEDGLRSTTVEKSIYAKAGKPVISAISVDRSPVYIIDTISFTVTAGDPDDTPWTVGVSWNGDTQFEKQLTVSTGNVTFKHPFPANETGTRSLLFRITDKDGQTSDSTLLVQVDAGRPDIALTHIDTSTDKIFIYDTRAYTLRATDPNGFIRKIGISWNGVQEPDFDNSANDNDTSHTFSHAFTDSGSYTVSYWTVDEDGVFSPTKSTTVRVRLAPPVVRGDTGDTLWVVVDTGFGDYYYRPQYSDTNGVIDTFFFGIDNTISTATKSTADSALLNIDHSRLHIGVYRYIWVKDDDDLVRGGKFVVFADSAPPKPISLNAVMNAGSDSILFMWGMSLDNKDSLATKAKIEICFGTEWTTGTTIKDWTPASQFAIVNYGGDKRLFAFKKEQTGDILWRVTFMDARGTQSISDPAPFTIP